ncbi:Serine-rich coiled-coil domain-containing protein 2 [Saguinus oedipus]|uniref:Serine-rich coiled-coil domain-containing protein 2 n=1 Tax=Saguinus oedipus TaxID=9490 RepID=A0ABQ9VIC0_SAGOE|nr:Serine-rich coiled-coil domain-containing protein 2 [Saguinus oedipus]
MLTRNSRQSEVLNGNEHLGYAFNRPYAAGGKKLALPNGPVDGNQNSSADRYVEEDATVLAEDRATNKDQELTENKSYRMKNNQSMKHDAKTRYLSDDVDDISLSSLSSSDKNDLSEDFSDYFIAIED